MVKLLMNNLKFKIIGSKQKFTIKNATPKFNLSLTSGARGLSAYELWLRQGNQGSMEDFFDSLKSDGGGNYLNLINRPSIENVELVGDKSLKDLGLQKITENEIKNLF